ncbi:MAG: HTH domain-containing protein [Chitinophagaceae bacterium]|nr:HTH domain-containing protein [Chitinophagaceae bacterium]
MSIERYLKLISSLDFYIRRKATGNTDEFSRKVGTSRRTLLRHLKDLKNLGFPIKYNKKRNSYIYTEEGSMTKSLFQNGAEISKDEQKEISGGFAIQNFPMNFYKFFKMPFDDTFPKELYNAYEMQGNTENL